MGRKRTCFSWARTPLPFPDLSFHLSSFLLPSSQATDLRGPGEEVGNRRKEGKHAGEAFSPLRSYTQADLASEEPREPILSTLR